MYKFVKGILSVYMHLFLKIKVSGAENIPSEGGAIICANHIHLLDPFAVGINTKRVISFMAKKDIFKSKLSAWFFTKLHAIPVNRDGNDAYALKKALGVINSQELLGIFPEGTREKDGKTLDIRLSREDLANLCNMTTSNAIRTLSAFTAEELINTEGRKIKILQEEEIIKIAELG